MDNYDILVIGGGPGGYFAAIRAAQLGAKVCLIEKDKVGGTCLNRGCIPTKAIIACTNLFEKIGKAGNYGITCPEPRIDLKAVIERKNRITDKIVKGVEFLLQKNGVEVIQGTATALNPMEVEVQAADNRRLKIESRKLILATGSSPAKLPGLEFDGDKFMSSDDILEYDRVPEKLDVVGGGVIGIHFAQIYSALGTEVTIYEALPEILPGIDEEVIDKVKRLLKRRKVTILTKTKFDQAKSCGKSLISIGRTPNTAGLEALGLKMDKRSVWVNAKQATSLQNVYAVGDLCSSTMLAHVAYEQGGIAAENALGGNSTFTYDFIPFGIYTHPEIGSVGLTEKAAKEKYGEVRTGRFTYTALGIAQAMGEIEGFIKVVADPKGKLLGVHILGDEATNLIGSATVALKNGLTVDDLGRTFQAHPSYPEGLQEAALNALKRSIHALN
ncbi:MAG: dihydrolipoyl dehydrogenase [Candidatus Saganbacteria bacterium]|nr:dihydrolipoyl dehydrogenase [Candidatus Saganbacteria bacterium]